MHANAGRYLGDCRGRRAWLLEGLHVSVVVCVYCTVTVINAVLLTHDTVLVPGLYARGRDAIELALGIRVD